jgi:hypothetical protein
MTCWINLLKINIYVEFYIFQTHQYLLLSFLCLEVWGLYFYNRLYCQLILFIFLLSVGFMVINATFNNITVFLWQSVLVVEETGGSRENHRPVLSHWQTLSHNVVLLALVIGTDCISSCESNYHMIMATTAPFLLSTELYIYLFICFL